MAMVLKTNTSAMNVNRNLGINSKGVNNSSRKLASGLKINRASDDASGLSISEKLKAQIIATQQASSNSQSGISVIQTADGAMGQIHNMLNRVSELTTQATNSIRSSGNGGKAIQAEIDALTSEIDRVAASTNFNGINLLNGSLDASGVNVDLVATESLQITTDIGGVITSSTGGNINTAGFSDFGDSITINGEQYTLKDDGSGASFEEQAASMSKLMQETWGDDLNISSVDGSISGVTSTDGYVSKTSYGDSLSLQVGTTANSYDKVSINIQSMSSSSLGLGNLDVTNPESASNALDLIKNAINTVSLNRAELGATQNRLEYTVDNLNNSAQNLSSANSIISETDMAKEIIEYSLKKAQEKAAEFKLAQANQNPYSVLKLI